MPKNYLKALKSANLDANGFHWAATKGPPQSISLQKMYKE